MDWFRIDIFRIGLNMDIDGIEIERDIQSNSQNSS